MLEEWFTNSGIELVSDTIITIKMVMKDGTEYSFGSGAITRLDAEYDDFNPARPPYRGLGGISYYKVTKVMMRPGGFEIGNISTNGAGSGLIYRKAQEIQQNVNLVLNFQTTHSTNDGYGPIETYQLTEMTVQTGGDVSSYTIGLRGPIITDRHGL